MKPGRHLEQARGEHYRAGSAVAPNPVRTLRPDEKHYLVWGILRLVLGVLQISFSAAAFLCLIFVGVWSSATLTCVTVATIATLASRALFHGQSGTHR